MSAIHQIYCTHCTHGSSALERREGELAGRMFGYSARAGSLESMDLRRQYRQIEPYVYYYLPRDTPSEQRLQLTAATAPRRLFFIPSTSGLQLLGQVCYRQTDTEGRPGSYFAHVLVQEERNALRRWTAIDCLRLWSAAGWTAEDSPSIPFLLAPLGSLDDLRASHPAAVDDRVLLSFLTAPADSPAFYDPGGVVPVRWRAMLPEARRRWFAEVLGGAMETSATRRESLLVVVEPALAALLFYGVVRLLPAGAIRDGLSFSTYEPQPERVGTVLAATWFADPESNGARPDASRLRGVTINTLMDPAAVKPRPSRYAAMMVPLLAERGWAKVEEKLESLRSAGPQRLEDLESLAGLDQTAAGLLAGECPAGQSWRHSAMETGYLRRSIGQRLAEMDDPSRRLAPVVGKPAHQVLVELAAAEPELPGTRRAVEFLLRSLAAEQIAALVQGDQVSQEHKLLVLVQYVTAHGDLPPNCDGIWEDGARGPDSPTQGKPLLLGDLLSRLDTKTLRQFYENVRQRHGNAFLLALAQASGQRASKRPALRAIVESLDEAALLSLYRSHGAALFAAYPEDEPTLGKKLREMLHAMADRPEDFCDRLDVLLAGRRLLRDQDDLDLLAAWERCRQAILQVDEFQNPPRALAGPKRTAQLDAAACRMAESAARAMPAATFRDAPNGARKQEFLRRIARQVLGGRELLPRGVWQHDELWRRIAFFFEKGWWPAARLKRPGLKLPLPKSSLARLGLAAAAVVLLALVAGWALRGRSPRPETQVALGARKNADPAPGDNRASPSPQTGNAAAPAKPRPSASEVPAKPPAEPPHGEPADSSDDPWSKGETATEPDKQTPRSPAKDTPEKMPEDRPPDGPPEVLPDQPPDPPKPPERPENSPQDPPPQPKPGNSSPDQAQQEWKTEAERLAQEHGGKYFDRRPMEGGLWHASPEMLGGLWASKTLRITGRVQLGGEAATFDVAWEESHRQYTLELLRPGDDPRLAVRLLKLTRDEQGIRFELDAEPRVQVADAAPALEKEIDALKARRQMLLATLNRKISNADDARDVEKNLLDLAGVRLPTVPPEPKREEQRFKDNPKAFDEEAAKFRAAKDERERIRTDLRDIGKRRVREFGQAVETQERDLNARQEKVRQENKEALRDLKAQPWTISVVICPDGPGLPERKMQPAASRQPAAAAKTSPPPAAPPSAQPPITGRFDIAAKRDPSLKPPAAAKIGPLFLQVAKRPLTDRWFTEAFVAECAVERPAQGAAGRAVTPPISGDARTMEVMEGVPEVHIRLRFFLRTGNPASPVGPCVGETDRYTQKIERGHQYTIYYDFDPAGLDRLRAAARERSAIPDLQDAKTTRRR